MSERTSDPLVFKGSILLFLFGCFLIWLGFYVVDDIGLGFGSGILQIVGLVIGTFLAIAGLLGIISSR